MAAEPVKLADLTQKTGLKQSTVYRIIQGLVANELVARNQANGYIPGRRLHELSSSGTSGLIRKFKPLITPSMVDLQARTGGTVTVGAIQQGWVRYFDVWHPRRHIHLARKVIHDAPPYCTATGKAIIAYKKNLSITRIDHYTDSTIGSIEALLVELAEVRIAGVAYSREEYIVGISSVAAPLFVPGRPAPFGAIAVGGESEEIDLFTCSVLVRQAAREITNDILTVGGFWRGRII